MRKTFHDELKDLQQQILKMGKLVEKAIKDSVKSLIDDDVSLADKVIKGDDKVDDLALSIEEQAMAIQARQSPVAKDLRLIYSVQFIAIHLERMGDLSLNIAKGVKRTSDEPRIKSLLDLLLKMGILTSKVVDTSLKAFMLKDLEIARKLPVMDEPIDALFKEFLKELSQLSAKGKSLDWASNMVLASRYLERIADHAVDIGERVCYLVTGEMRELD